MLVELGPPQHAPYDRGRLVEDLQRLGAEHRSGLADAFVVERYVEVLRSEDRRRRTAGCPELQLAALAHAAAELEELAQGDAERRFVLAGALHVTGERVDREALGLLGAHRAEPLDAAANDRRHGSDRFDVVDHGRAGVEALDGGERWTQSRLTAASLERVEQRCLLAADVGACTGVNDEVDVEARAQDVLPR